MANVITNILTFHGYTYRIRSLKTAVMNDEFEYGSIDFNKIIATPPDISKVSRRETKTKPP